MKSFWLDSFILNICLDFHRNLVFRGTVFSSVQRFFYCSSSYQKKTYNGQTDTLHNHCYNTQMSTKTRKIAKFTVTMIIELSKQLNNDHQESNNSNAFGV